MRIPTTYAPSSPFASKEIDTRYSRLHHCLPAPTTRCPTSLRGRFRASDRCYARHSSTIVRCVASRKRRIFVLFYGKE